MVRRRIPHPEVEKEVRQAFQHLNEDSSILTDGTSGQILVGAGIGVAPAWTDQSAIDHGAFGGLGDDDHTIYLLADGTRNLSGDLTVTGSGTFNFIDLPEIATPASPDSNKLRLFVEDFKGFSFYSFIDDTGMVRKIVRDSIFVARNISGSTILANRAVYASGSSEGVPTIEKARANNVNTMPAIGVTLENIANNAFGRVMQVGLVENVDTSSFSAGNVLYVSSAVAGILVATAPLYPNIRQEIGTVLVSDASVGSVQVIARSMFNEGILDHGGLLGLTDDDHTQYLLVDGTRNLTGNLTVDALVTIDGRDLSVDGAKLDGVEAGADVTDATNVAAAGAAMSGGAFHDGFSDFVAAEHTDAQVKVDSGATAGYLGAASNDGVLRTGAPLTYTDGGDYVTLDVDQTDYIPSMTNDNAGSIVIGQAVYVSSADSVDLARANDSTTSEVIGLVADTSIASSASGQIRTSGILTATTAQWDAVAGTTGGLTVGAVYYLSDAVAGGLVEVIVTKPGSFLVRIGVALSTTEMRLVIGTTSPIEPTATPFIDTDTTLYITTGGNDSTGDGTSGNPWATLSKALTWLSDKIIENTTTVTIEIDDGTYNWTSTDSMKHNNGDRVNVVGKNTYNVSLTSVQSSSGSSGAWSIILNVSDVSNAAVNDFLRVPYDIANGTRPETLCGCWKITNVDVINTRLTITSTHRHTSAPSGAVAGTVTIIKTMIEYDGVDGIEISENSVLGLLDKLVVLGTGSATGISVLGGAYVQGGTTLCAYNFANGMLAKSGGHFEGDYFHSCGNATRGFRCYFATGRAVGGVFSGNGNAGVGCDTADVILNNIIASGNVSYGVNAEASCNLSPVTAACKATYNTGTGMYAAFNSFVNALSADVSNNGTNFSPAANTLGNVESYIRN